MTTRICIVGCGAIGSLFAAHLARLALPEAGGVEGGEVAAGAVVGGELGAGELEIFGAVNIAQGVWSLTPSLNLPGLIHCFVVLYEVPPAASWLQSTVLRVK